MEFKMIIKILIIQMIAILSLVFIVVFILRYRKSIEIERKFSQYTIEPLKNDHISFLDKIYNMINSIIKELSKLLSKSQILMKYGESYNRHISFEELKYKTGIDFVSTKFLIGFFAIVLYIFTQTFKYKKFTLVELFLSFILGFFVLDVFIYIDYRKKRKQIEEDLLKAIIIMNNTFKSGRSTVQAVEIVKDELTGAISDEFKKIHLDISYGLSIETVFDRFYDRVKLEDAKYISTSLTLLNKTGGNIVKVFESIEREFYNRKKLDNELKTMTSSSVFVFRMLLFMPFIIYLLISALNKDFFSPLFKSPLGYLILGIIIILYILYADLIKKVLRIKL